jgi:MFS family permease
LVDTVGSEKIGQWMGIAMSMSSFGLIISPLFGGIVYHKAGYMAVFLMILGLIVVDIVMRLFMIEKKYAAKYLKNSPINETSASGDGATHQQRAGNDNCSSYSTIGVAPSVESSPTVSAESTENTALLYKTSSKPTVQKSTSKLPTMILLLLSPRVSANIYGIFVNVSIGATFDGVLPLFVKNTFQWNALDAGLIYLCLAIPALLGPLVGKLTDHIGPKWIAVSGCVLTSIPLFLMRFVEENTTSHKVLLGGLLVLTGKFPWFGVGNQIYLLFANSFQA